MHAFCVAEVCKLSAAVAFVYSQVSHQLYACKGSAFRACKLGIRQPQTGSFRARHRCLCSEYRSSIPAPCASPDTKISLFAVLRSFARGIFRPDDIEKSGNTCCIPGFFCDGWAEKGRAKPAVSLICTPFCLRGVAKPSPRTGERSPRAACGRKSEGSFSAAVENCKDQRKPAAVFGYRKVDRGTACGG